MKNTLKWVRENEVVLQIEPFLYNKGKGKYIPISQLVLLRNKERARHKLVSTILGN